MSDSGLQAQDDIVSPMNQTERQMNVNDALDYLDDVRNAGNYNHFRDILKDFKAEV